MAQKHLHSALQGPVTADEPVFFGHPMIDGLVGTVTTLASELYITRDRLRILEAVLSKSGLIAPDAVETHTEDAASEAERLASLKRYVERVLSDLVVRPRPDSRIAEDVTRLALQDPAQRLR